MVLNLILSRCCCGRIYKVGMEIFLYFGKFIFVLFFGFGVSIVFLFLSFLIFNINWKFYFISDFGCVFRNLKCVGDIIDF